MADTGEDREIRQRANAHEAEVVRESKKLSLRARPTSMKKKVTPGSTPRPKSKAGS
jgi:hypothetical protein